MNTSAAAVAAFCQRHFMMLAGCVLLLTIFNLTFRLTHEHVTEWDESLYANSAAEVLETGRWIDTPFLGERDYYNSKPPLNIWLIALSFKLFGLSIFALRLPSVIAAVFTVAALMAWGRRCCGAVVALAAGIVLSSCFAFVYVHAGRTANTDAWFTLLVVLTAITLWASLEDPRRAIWLGPIAAATFLLRGMGVLLPGLIIVVVLAIRWTRRPPIGLPVVRMALLFAIPVMGWAVARWQVDQWAFLSKLFLFDFVERSLRPLEGHTGSWFYYFDVLQKYQYDWLIAMVVSLLLAPALVRRLRRVADGFPDAQRLRLVLAVWAAVAFIIPTLMQTKTTWYLGPFYPVFALAVGWVLTNAFLDASAVRRVAMSVVFVAAFSVAEGKLLWHSTNHRDLAETAQGLLMAEKGRLSNQNVYRVHWDFGDTFVASRLVGARPLTAVSIDEFIRLSDPGDYLLGPDDLACGDLIAVAQQGRHYLFVRRAEGLEHPERRCRD